MRTQALKITSDIFLLFCFLSFKRSTFKTFFVSPNFRSSKFKFHDVIYNLNMNNLGSKGSLVTKFGLFVMGCYKRKTLNNKFCIKCHDIEDYKILKFEYLKNEKSFRSEVKNIFPSFNSAVF